VAATSCANGWTFVNTDPVVSREGVRMGPRGGNHKGSNVALALARGVRFARGTIDVDLTGLGAGQASFLGVAFHVVDDKRFESVYLRHAHVEVTDDRVRVFVDHASTPCLDVARLGADHDGAVGLFTDSQEGSFAHLKIVSN